MSTDSTPLQEWISGEAGLPDVAANVAAALGLDAAPVTLWLHGDMGMGKTTLMGHLLRALGLPAGYPVTSPTFSLVNEYTIGGKHYAHLDLYRLAGGTVDEGLLDHREFTGVFIEWPAAVTELELVFPATHHLVITADEAGQRRYSLY